MADRNVNGVSNGVTDVTVVSAPASSTTRMIPRYGISIYNGDTESATVYFQLKDGVSDRPIEKAVIPSGDTYFNTSFISLSTVDQSLEFYLDAVVTTNELTFVGKYRDEAQ